MKLVTLGLRLTVVIALSVAMPMRPAAAQQRSSGTVSTANLEAFAAAHVEVAALRSTAQAELAEPRSKKAEVQAGVRERLQQGTLRVLKAHGLTEAEFTRLTRLVSTDDAVRKQFEEAVARVSAGRGG